jgi:hypothetical protein
MGDGFAQTRPPLETVLQDRGTTPPKCGELCKITGEMGGRIGLQSVYAQELSRAVLPEIRTRLGTPKILR